MHDNDWKPPYIDEIMEALERGETIHRIICDISWNPIMELPEKYLPIVRTTLNQFTEVNNLTMYMLRVDKDQIFICLQLDPNTALDDTIKQMQKTTESALKSQFKNIDNEPIWREDYWVESTDSHTLNERKCDS